jgi:hypothetical protein
MTPQVSATYRRPGTLNEPIYSAQVAADVGTRTMAWPDGIGLTPRRCSKTKPRLIPSSPSNVRALDGIRERDAIEDHDQSTLSARLTRSGTSNPAPAHGLRSRVRRFESCWGRTVSTSENSGLNWQDAECVMSPTDATVRRGTTGYVGFHSLYAPAWAERRSRSPRAETTGVDGLRWGRWAAS